MMNEVLELLRTRRSVAPHLLGGPGPTPDELDLLLTVAARVPDHGRLTPWRFIVLEGEARHRIGETIAAACRADDPAADEAKLALERARLARAPLVVAIVSRARPHVKIPEWEQTLSAGAVCMTLVIAANAAGFAHILDHGMVRFRPARPRRARPRARREHRRLRAYRPGDAGAGGAAASGHGRHRLAVLSMMLDFFESNVI